MLRLQKETLAELTPDQMATVVGAYKVAASCVAASCITVDINHTTTTFMRFTDGC